MIICGQSKIEDIFRVMNLTAQYLLLYFRTSFLHLALSVWVGMVLRKAKKPKAMS
jgi:hypothetical protein